MQITILNNAGSKCLIFYQHSINFKNIKNVFHILFQIYDRYYPKLDFEKYYLKIGSEKYFPTFKNMIFKKYFLKNIF